MMSEKHVPPRRDGWREWPTWCVLAVCYAVLGAATWNYAALGPWFFAPIAACTVTLHSSLQHEMLHGHPTRSARLNEALVGVAVGLLIPYRRFREAHLRHHCDDRLTDPYDDPESWYLAEGDWTRLSAPMHLLLRVNATLAGRLLIGPALSCYGLWRADARLIVRGDREVAAAYLIHALGVIATLGWVVGVAGMNPLTYLVLAAYPGMSLLMIRTYIEHRADLDPVRRTAIVEASLFFRLLFLNNNLHFAHHLRPSCPWYELPALYANGREAMLAENGGYLILGYGAVFRKYLLCGREPLVHPFLRRGNGGGAAKR